MSRTSLGLSTFLLGGFIVAPACDEPDPPPPSIEGKSAEEAADLTLEIACDYVARCGILEVTCADCVEGDACGGCMTEQIPVSATDCADEIGPRLTAGFSCQALTAEEEALVDECLAALPSAECPAVQAVDDWANGGGGDDPRDALEACDVLDRIMSRCSEPDENVSEPSPG